jgi:hypothetical protein
MRRSAFVPATAPALASAACRDSLDNLESLRGACSPVGILAPSVEPVGLFVSELFWRIASYREATNDRSLHRSRDGRWLRDRRFVDAGGNRAIGRAARD